MLADLSTTRQRAIIIAAGEGTRWNNYLGVPKHFIEVDGEPIIERTVRLLLKYGVSDVQVVGPDDDRYRIDGSTLYVPELRQDCDQNCGADKFLSSKSLWLEDGRTIALYGDCYFTDDAIEKITGYAHKDWLLFARARGSEITGCPWGECFAQSFFNDHIPEHLRTLERAVELHHDKQLRHPSGWQHYRAMIGLPVELWDGPYWGDRMVWIDDFTDDFDSPEDHKTWMRHWESRP